MATVNKRLEALERAARPGAGELVEVINVSLGEDGQAQSTREQLTPAEYHARYGHAPSSEPISVRVIW